MSDLVAPLAFAALARRAVALVRRGMTPALAPLTRLGLAFAPLTLWLGLGLGLAFAPLTLWLVLAFARLGYDLAVTCASVNACRYAKARA